MVKIFNPLRGQDPLGATLAQMGRDMFGNGTANALNNEKLYAAQRENTEIDNLGRRISTGGGAQALSADPIAQAMMVASGYDPSKFGDMALLGGATQYGARDPRTQNLQVGTGQAYDNTAGAFDLKLGETRRNNDLQSGDRRYGVDQSRAQQMHEFTNIGADEAVDNAETARNNNIQSGDRRYGVDVGSADRRYGDDLASRDRRYGVDQGRAQQMHEFDNKPIAALGPDGPIFQNQSALVGGDARPILSETDQKGTLLGQNFDNLPALNPNQQEVLGARVNGDKAGTPRNYIMPDGRVFMTYDGVTDAQTRQPLPVGGHIGTVEGATGDVGLTNSTTSGVQQNIIANNKFKNLAAMTREAAMRDPNNFGVPGFVKGVAQDVRQISQGLASGLGFTDMQTAVDSTLASAARNGIDPSLSELHTLADLMVYSAAEALAGQSGRSVSDKDVLMFKQIVGDPRSWLMSQEKYLAKLTQIERILDMNQTTLGDTLQQGAVPQTGPAGGTPIDDLVNKYRSR